MAETTSVHYEPGFIVLSYIISLTGCISTLELLHRRTSVRGAFNWYLLIAASITMGGIGIWSMHLIGNRAIIMANNTADRQLLYNQGYTALSFFLPIVVLTIAFHLLAVRGKASKVNILISGLLTGTAVCAMHYVGQIGIANYDCTYRIANILGAAIIAVMASLIALSIFFRMRETWTDSWWKRSLCAALLAGAVSGMHWTAAVGTTYHFRPNGMSHGSKSRVQTVIFCAVLSFASCVLLLVIAFITRHRSRTHKKRAQELVLACVYLDEDDRVMVSNDGFLPYQKITNQFVRKTFGDDELNRTHPAFMWVYEASRNWSALGQLVPGIRDTIDLDPVARRYQPGYEDSIDLSRSGSADFNIIFKHLFCIAAEKLAIQIHEPMDSLGVISEEPLQTGTTRPEKTIANRLSGSHRTDTEKGHILKMLGRGRYLFLNRRLNKTEAADFAARGYRFGSIFHIAESLARKMQVNQENMLCHLERMKVCISKEHLHPAGIHLACFALRPNVHTGFDILTPTISQNQLPLITLPITEIQPSHMEIIYSVDERKVREILAELITEKPTTPNQDRDFRWQLYSAFVRLVDMVNDPEMMMEARFSAKPIHAPSRSPEGLDIPASCVMFSVRYLGSIHSSCSQKDLTYVPFDFFSAQQVVETSEARHQAFKQKATSDFGSYREQSSRRRQSEAIAHSEVGSDAHSSTARFWHGLQVHSDKITSIFNMGRRQDASRRPQSATAESAKSSSSNTAKFEVTDSCPGAVKGLNVNIKIRQTGSVDTPSSTVVELHKTISGVQNDDITPVTLTDARGTFVSELFVLFQLSDSPTRDNLAQGRQRS